MELTEFIKVNNIENVEKNAKKIGHLYNEDGNKIVHNIYNALRQVNASDELIKKILSNLYTWHELILNPLAELQEFVKEGKLDESGVWYWLVSD